MFINEEFLKLYEKLSLLNEAPLKHPIIYFKDVIGYKDGAPILKQSNNAGQKTLLDFVKKDQPTPPGLPEDKSEWVINSSRLSTATRIEMCCSNPACRYGGMFTPTIKTINERIWGVNKAWRKFASEQSVEDIALCPGCVDDRNMSARKVAIEGTAIWGAYKMSEIGGFDEDGKVIGTDDLNSSLLAYLNIPASLEINTDLRNIDPKYWPAFDEKRTFYYNCPECGLPNAMKGTSLRDYAKSGGSSAKDIIKCRICKKRSQSGNYGVSIAEKPIIWERIPDWFFEDKSMKEESILTKKGAEFLIQHNSENTSNKVFIQNLMLAFDSHNAPKIKAAKHFTLESNLKLPFVCTNLDCIKRNEDTAYEYISTPHLVNKATVYRGCPKCASVGRTHSAAELFLRASIEILFNVQHMETKRIQPYNDIDILFNYNGNTFGIEYDGKRFHQDPKTIQADESKVRAFSDQQGINFIRVRENGCADFNKNEAPAELIYIYGWLLDISWVAYEECLTKIGKFVTKNEKYKIPEEVLPALKELFINKASARRSKNLSL
jgi:hypothetical protein